MTSRKDTSTAALLPAIFKKVGLALILLTVLSIVSIKLLNIELSQTLKELLPTITLNLVIAGLLLISLTRDKEEDEMTLSLRWKAMVWAFIAASVYVIITPLANLLFKQSTHVTGQHIVLFMLIGFLIMYTYLKRTR